MNPYIKEIKKNNRYILGPIFSNMHDALLQSCLQGHMGGSWADDEKMPTCAQIIVGDFACLAGNAGSPSAGSLVTHIPVWFKSKEILIVPETQKWGALIEEFHKGRFNKIQRYSISEGKFDIKNLNQIIKSLPAGYRVCPIDSKLYEETMKNSWSNDFCSLFESAEDYVRRGIGFCVLSGDEIVCGASSYAIYDDGIEIEIDTRQDHRRKGLAAACAATLILECLERGLNPRWDAANMESVKLAEKLGYHLKSPYDTWAVSLKETEG